MDDLLEYENLVFSIISKYSNYFDRDDLYQVGMIGLIDAYKHFDESGRRKRQSSYGLQESLKDDIYDLLDEIGGYADYQGRIEAVAEEFGLSKDDAETYVCNWIQDPERGRDFDECVGGEKSYSRRVSTKGDR